MPGCLFSGSIIDVPANDMRDAGVMRVECPECLTMRGLTPQGKLYDFLLMTNARPEPRIVKYGGSGVREHRN